MKYFANIHSADELRKAYRANVINMHPDRGGNEEEFKAMQAEFESLKKQYQNGTAYTYESHHQETAEERARREAEEAREREEWARWEAEERARREQEEHEKAERIRKAQEISRAAVRAWAGILERVAADATGQKARFYRFNDKKEAAAFVATTKRNIKAVINHYFPGLKVAVKISGEIWKEKFVISWEDGPSVQTLRDTCKELAFFLPACYHCADMGEDYGHYEEDHATAPWREAYGQALGDIDDFETVRTLSDEGKQEAEALAARILSGWDNVEGGRIRVTLSEFCNLREALGFDRLNDRRMYWTNYANNDRRENGEDVADMYRDALRRVIYENATITVTEQEKADRRAAEFRPRYGKALKLLQQLTGVGNADKDGDAVCFFTGDRNSRRRLTIAEAVERLEQGEAVSFGTEHKNEDGTAWYWGKFAGGYKTQDKRAEKFAAAGLTIRGHVSPNSFISLHGIAPEFAAAIRADLEDIEKQRKEWEAKQSGTQQADNSETANEPTESNRTSSESNAESISSAAESRERKATAKGESVTTAQGLTMEKYSEKATIIRGYNADQLAELLAMGGKEWRNLKGGKGVIFSTRRHGDELAAWMEQQQGEGTTAPAADEPTATASESEPEALRGATLQEIERKSDRTAAPAWLKPGATFKRTTSDGREVVAICTRLLLDGFAYITANGCAVVDHVAAFAGYNFDGLTPCDIDDNAPEFANMLRNFQRIRKGFEEYQTAHPYTDQGDTLHEAQDKAPESTERPDTTDEPAESEQEAADLLPVLQAFADFFGTLSDIMQQAKQWDGVTIPAATLERWKQEAEDGTKTAAARLCEVCACLASLTPDSRRDFDALGAIFWSLSEQIRNGCNPDTLQAATDYARAQLFDLIDRTQNENQARAVREANEQRKAA